MIAIVGSRLSDALQVYARGECVRILSAMTDEPITVGQEDAAARVRVVLGVASELGEDEIELVSDGAGIEIKGGGSAALLHAVYSFLERMGCVFDLSGETFPPAVPCLGFPVMRLRHRPSVPSRGIRMHLNFVQDQSFWTEKEFARFVDDMARQKLNLLLFHMYTPQLWFPFEYRGVRHLGHSLGNLNRRPLSPDMIGRKKVKVKEHWFPREFESIRDPEELLTAMHGRYRRMMARSKSRGIRSMVSFEPESLPSAITSKIPDWTNERPEDILATGGLCNEWQQEWSGVKLADPDIRHPLVIDIAVAECLQCVDAFPDLDGLQLISREGTVWRPSGSASYEAEIDRLCHKFSLPESLFDQAAMGKVVPPDEGPEMNAKAHPYWTVLPGDTYRGCVLGAVRFVEYAIAILSDPRVSEKLAARKVEPSIAVYSPDPEVVRLMMPVVAAILPRGARFHYLADYGARDIAAKRPAGRPLADARRKIGVISWYEFDGTMMLAQGWSNSLGENVRLAVELGADTMLFNHWRLRGIEHNAASAAAACWDVSVVGKPFEKSYFGRLYGEGAVEAAAEACRLLEEATVYGKAKTYNIGFTNAWVITNSTAEPGYHWRRLAKSADSYAKAAQAFQKLAASCAERGRGQAAYMADLCDISSRHIRAVAHLQNAKLPLIGYKAWPLGNPHACWPPPNMLKPLVREARKALKLEREYMRVYAKWVKTSDQQGQLCMHQQGVIEPFERFAEALDAQLERELAAARSGWPESDW